MAKITSPFNFVPLSDIVFYPDWADNISHDIPFRDGEDGVLELEITNMSPLYIGAGNKDNMPAHVVHNGRRHFYIPGSTLKGCFRNVMEILSYGKMQQFEDDSFGYREFGRDTPYLKLVKDVKCGWLWKEDNKCYIKECVKGIQKIHYREISKKGYDRVGGYPILHISSKECSYKEGGNVKAEPEGDYHLVRTGKIRDKHHDYLFSVECKERVEVSADVIHRFETVHKETPVFQVRKKGKGELRKLYDNGDPIPVFFLCDESGVSVIGLTRMLKYPFQHSIQDLVRRNYGVNDWGEFIRQRDLPECIFGYTGDSSLKGRVQIGNAFITEPSVDDEDLLTVTGVLGQPKASFYPLYLKQDGSGLVNYSTTQSTIAGRKRYRITKGFDTIELATGKPEVSTTFKALPAHKVFKCRIAFHNLKKAEIGALLASIKFNQIEGCYHNIGMAKAFGYGVISCDVKPLTALNHEISDYVDFFTELMARFLDENGRRDSLEDIYGRLASIASPTHNQEEMKQMGFKECGACKKPYTTLLSEQSRKDALGAFVRYDVKAMCDSAQVYVSENKFDKAVELLKKACLHMTSSGLDASDINQMIAECQTKERLYDEAQERQAEEQRALDAIRKQNEIEAGKLARKERGLAFLLEKKVSGDELKISSLMQGVSRIKDFLKKNHGYGLTDNDAESVHRWLCSIEVPTKKQEKKDFQDWNGQSWEYLSSQFADAQKWFEEVNAKDSLK